jgi:hypothetical protein
MRSDDGDGVLLDRSVDFAETVWPCVVARAGVEGLVQQRRGLRRQSSDARQAGPLTMPSCPIERGVVTVRLRARS